MNFGYNEVLGCIPHVSLYAGLSSHSINTAEKTEILNFFINEVYCEGNFAIEAAEKMGKLKKME